MPTSSTLLDQAHNAMDRKLFAMKGFHHPGGSLPAFLTGLAHLYNLIPYQRRALHAGQCGVEVEGGRIVSSFAEEIVSTPQHYSMTHERCGMSGISLGPSIRNCCCATSTS